ncbi:hypothetical protein SAMN04489712_11242 [Thermomonospora echinospora]|uniref:Uncharacterized protein n=1 Tax=Thermomonospora echinospora TaxID=1992 RepID=A0A1H6CZI8_9ACTN|nr:hypothetical protein [Thermomonospora echinospora]SEG78184.1 hypothetical protein SAMN04489712_11242 [Thermomonospora echinospora]
MSGIDGFYWWGESPGARFPTARLKDDRYRNLAGLLTSDIQTHGAGVLDALLLVEQARGGRTDIEEWVGNSTSAYFRPDGVSITDLGPEPQTQRYSLGEVHEALIKYWEFLCPSGGERRSALEEWARSYRQEHPQTTDPQHPCLAHLPL